MKKKQGNIYLDALEYGEEQLEKRKTTTFGGLQKYLEGRGYKFKTKQEERLLWNICRETFHIYYGEHKVQSYLNIEGYFKLLEYRELNEARKSSREAKTYAIVAILISFAAFIASIYFSIMVLDQEIVIDNKQYGVIENIWHKLEPIDFGKHNKGEFHNFR